MEKARLILKMMNILTMKTYQRPADWQLPEYTPRSKRKRRERVPTLKQVKPKVSHYHCPAPLSWSRPHKKIHPPACNRCNRTLVIVSIDTICNCQMLSYWNSLRVWFNSHFVSWSSMADVQIPILNRHSWHTKPAPVISSHRVSSGRISPTVSQPPSHGFQLQHVQIAFRTE